jgi:hypothetical protein
MSININLWAVVVGTLVAFFVGGLWYSPKMFLNIWLREAGVNGECKKHGIPTYLLAFVMYFISAFVLAIFLGPNPPLVVALITSFVVGFAWVVMSFGINYLFADRSLKLFLIDGSYHLVQFMLYGLVLGLWH